MQEGGNRNALLFLLRKEKVDAQSKRKSAEVSHSDTSISDPPYGMGDAGGRDRTAEGTKPLEPQSSPVDRCGTPANNYLYTKIPKVFF